MSTATTTVRTTPQPPTQPRKRTGRRVAVGFGIFLLVTAAGLSGYVAVEYNNTENDIQAFRDEVIELSTAGGPDIDWDAVSDLPEPVQRWADYTFPNGPVDIAAVATVAEGDFRRPNMETFEPTVAQELTTTAVPALVFSARASMPLGTWARAYDAYLEGEMEMKAKILSTLTVVDEEITPELNQTSLQRWLLEAPLYPTAMLPGGVVTWEAIDDTHARAVVTYQGDSAALVATINEEGQPTSFEAEEDGDLTTSYHGSGEYVSRSDYREVEGMMIPFEFEIARAADGEQYPFWRATVTEYTVNPTE